MNLLSSIEKQTARHEKSAPIPVTVVAGFLGAGKTTLINHVLSGDHGRKIAVVVNDFGSINIDAELITNLGDGMVSLANGCICCVVRNDLTHAVLQLAALAERPDHIVIESSGVADPAGVVRSFMEPGIWKDVILDGVMTVVDAEQCFSASDNEADQERQIVGADLVVLNKTDLVDAAGLSQARAHILHAKPGVQIIEAAHCNLPTEVILGIHTEIDGQNELDPASDLPPDHGHAFETWRFEAGVPLDLGLLQQLLQRLPTDLLRAKGFVYAADKPHHRILLQLVGRRATLAVNDVWSDAPPKTRLVFIARRGTCNFKAIERALQACVVMANGGEYVHQVPVP